MQGRLIANMMGKLIFDATANGWQVRGVARSTQSEARYVTLRFARNTIVVRIATHRKKSGKWDWQLLSMEDVIGFRRVLKATQASQREGCDSRSKP